MVPNDARAEDIPHQTAWCRHCAGLIRYWPPQHAWRHVRLGLAESAGHPPEPLPAPPDPSGAVLVTEETLAAALISSGLIPRYAEYAQDAHEWTMQREGHEVLGDQWAAAILARIREGQQGAADSRTCIECDEPWPCEATVTRRKDGIPHRLGFENPAAVAPATESEARLLDGNR